jgi:SAM-dependent methyltransferase
LISNPLPILSLLACPYDGASLEQKKNCIECPLGHSFPLINDVPVLLRADVTQTVSIASESLRLSRLQIERGNEDPYFIDTLGLSDDDRRRLRATLAQTRGHVDPIISYLVSATNGMLYKHLVGTLQANPIPILPLPNAANGELLLDIGCSWGRWSMAAYNKGYNVVGLDPSLGAVLAAKRLADKLSVPFIGVVGDARYLPFKSGAFDVAFSYSVLQHFSKCDARIALREIRRSLRASGLFAVQMASAWGVRSFQHQVKRRFREPTSFEVRYWSPIELRDTSRAIFGKNVRISADCYFGLGLQASDLDLMPTAKKFAIYGSEALKKSARWFAPLTYLADSLFLQGNVTSTCP